MDENTRPWYTIDELNAWADKYQNEQWHKAAIRLGEELASVGPVGYYEMDASEWLDWALNQLKEKNMKSEQIKHSLSVGVKSIQSRVYDRETDEVISFVKIPIKDSGLVRCECIELTDEDRSMLIRTLKWSEDLLRIAGHDEAVSDVQDCIMLLRKAQKK